MSSPLRGTARGVLYALERLTQQGLVTQRTVGASDVYQINRDHLMFPAIDAAFSLADPWARFSERTARLATDAYPDANVTIAIFGSVARGDADLDSDVDLLVVVGVIDDQAEEFRSRLVSAVHRWTGQQAGVFLTTPQWLATAHAEHDPIVESFRAEAVTVFGPEVRDYLKGGTA